MTRRPFRQNEPVKYVVQQQHATFFSRILNVGMWALFGPLLLIVWLGKTYQYLMWLMVNTGQIALAILAIPFLIGVLLWFIGSGLVGLFALAASGGPGFITAILIAALIGVSLLIALSSDDDKPHIRGSSFSSEEPPTYPSPSNSTRRPIETPKPSQIPRRPPALPTRPTRRR